MGEPDLAEVAGPLYALPLTDFVAARTAAAKDLLSAGPATAERRALASAVRSLPKPSLAAWAVNMLAAHRPGTLRELASLGSDMRAAQSGLDTETLRSLSQQRSACFRPPSELPGPSRKNTAAGSAALLPRRSSRRCAPQQPTRARRRLCRAGCCCGLWRRTDCSTSTSQAPWRRRSAVRRGTTKKDMTPPGTTRPARKQAARPGNRGLVPCSRRPVPRTPAALDRALAELQEAERAAREATGVAVRRSVGTLGRRGQGCPARRRGRHPAGAAGARCRRTETGTEGSRSRRSRCAAVSPVRRQSPAQGGPRQGAGAASWQHAGAVTLRCQGSAADWIHGEQTGFPGT